MRLFVLLCLATLALARDPSLNWTRVGKEGYKIPILKSLPAFASQEVYVRKGGNDLTGKGTLDWPYLTIQRAMTDIVDASQTKHYTVNLGAGDFADSFAFKPWTGISGIASTSGYQGVTSITASFSFDPSWTGSVYSVAWFSHITFNNAAPFDIQNVNAQLTFFDCEFNSGASFTGHHSGNVNNIVWDDCLAYGAVSVQDCQYFFPIGGTSIYDDTLTITSTSAVFPSTTTLLALGGTVSYSLVLTSGAGSGGAIGDMRGCSVQGTLTLNGAATQYTGTVESIPETVVLTGGAPAPTYYSYATSLGYAPGAPGNWANPPPKNVQQALDRMAALLFANFGAIP
jgi:hypothetical protein